MNNIEELVVKYLPSNEEAVNSNNHLKWVEKLCDTIGKYYQMGNLDITQGTLNGKYGYNLRFSGYRSSMDLYFRIEHFGVEFQNDKKIYTECTDELTKKVIDYCTQYFKRTI